MRNSPAFHKDYIQGHVKDSILKRKCNHGLYWVDLPKVDLIICINEKVLGGNTHQ